MQHLSIIDASDFLFSILFFFLLFFKYWGQLQFGIAIFLMVDARVRGVLCDGINAKTLALLSPPMNATNSGGGACYDPSSRRLDDSTVLGDNPTCSLESVLVPANAAVGAVVSATQEVNNTITTLDEAFQPIKGPIEEVIEFFADKVYEPLKPFLEAVGEIQPVFDTVADVIDSIPTCDFW